MNPDETTPEAFTREEYNPGVPLHRLALAGLTAMNQHPDFDPERTHVIILLQDGELATVAPLNYLPPDDKQTEAVIGDIVEHARSLSQRMGYPPPFAETSQNGTQDDHGD